MPTHQNSSLSESPFSYWLNLTTTRDEFENLRKTLQGIPKFWVEWAEKQVKSREDRGVKIDKPLAYRLSVLWHGIILLQEGKFICDVTENAFRQSFIQHTIDNQIAYADIQFVGWDEVKPRFEKGRGTIVLSSIPSINFLCLFSFSQLIWTMYNNWDRTKKEKPGFKNLFLKGSSCKNRNTFIGSANIIKDYRNEIAHSKKLFTPEEIQKLYKNAHIVLKPLDIEIEQRVLSYRGLRPRFLEDLEIR